MVNDDVETNDLVLDGAGRSHLRSRLVTMETKLCIPAFIVVYCITRHGDDACVDEIGVHGSYRGYDAERPSHPEVLSFARKCD